MRAVVAFSLGYPKDNPPGISNIGLAKVADLAFHVSCADCLAVQWEVALATKTKPLFVVYGHRKPNTYFDSDEVASQIADYLREFGVDEVVVIAHTFIHQWYCERLFKKLGFRIVAFKVPWTPFDPDSWQWWCRSPIHFFVYGVLRTLFNMKGRYFFTNPFEQERSLGGGKKIRDDEKPRR